MDVIPLDGELHHSHAKAVTAVSEGALNAPESFIGTQAAHVGADFERDVQRKSLGKANARQVGDAMALGREGRVFVVIVGASRAT
jgi:hypothetical protein